MKVIVITGSTRGIGLGLAEAFLDRGCAVIISGRSANRIECVLADLASRFDADRVFGYACDVSDYEQVQALWDATISQYGRIDIWINNAGVSYTEPKFWLNSPRQVQEVVTTNLVGVMFGAMVALEGMSAQGFGSFYNMEGFGSDGRWNETLTLYGTSKYGVSYLTQALTKETKGTSILVGALSPGMVVTDLLIGDFENRPEAWEEAKRIFNVLADEVEVVAPWMADQVLRNTKTGVRIKWLTGWKIFFRFLLAPFRKRDLFSSSS